MIKYLRNYVHNLSSQMENSSCFANIIGTAVKEFNHKYATTESLQQILKDFDDLSEEEHSKYTADITRITHTIKHCGIKNKKLTNHQAQTLYGQLNQLNCRLSKKYKLVSLKYVEISALTKKVLDDDIALVAFNLMTNLEKDVMSSTLNVYVAEHFENIGHLMDYAPNEHLHFILEINGCLQEHGGEATNDYSCGGFQSDPNRIALLDDLKKIMDKLVCQSIAD